MASPLDSAAGTEAIRASKCSKSWFRPLHVTSVFVLIAAFLTPRARAYQSSPRFLFISSPTTKQILYLPLKSFEQLTKFSEERGLDKAKMFIDGTPEQPVAPTPAPAAADDDDDDDVKVTYSCLEGDTCQDGGDAAIKEQLDGNIRVHSKDVAITTEDCQSACTEANDCTGIQINKEKTDCRFWLKSECDVTKGGDTVGYTSDTEFTTCTKQIQRPTTTTTTTTTATATLPNCIGCLERPEGLAMWHGKDKAVLYVADSAMGKIFSYEVTGTMSGDVSAGQQQQVAQGIPYVTGLALDGFGNLYYSTGDGAVGVLSAEKLQPLDSPEPTILYASDTVKTVQSPMALAADNFHLFWANTANGQQEGVIVTAFERDVEAMLKKYPAYPKPLSKNIMSAMGVCIAKNNVFFTAESQFLYGVKTSGGTVAEVYKSFEKPRGCAYDRDSTLYIADEAGKIFSMPANFPTMRPVKRMQQIATAESPSALAVFTCSAAYGGEDGTSQSQDKGFLNLGW